MRTCLMLLALTLAIVFGIEKLTNHQPVSGPWPPEPEYKVVVTNNGPLFYVE